MDNYISETICSFIDFLDDSANAYQEAVRDLDESIREIQDLLHFIEFEKADAVTMTQAYKKLKTARQKRRCAKNTIELLEQLVRWRDKYENILNQLNKKVLPAIQATEAAQIRREYYIRTDILKSLTDKDRLGYQKKNE